MRNWLIVFFFAVMILASFLAWGDLFEEMFSESGATERLENYGKWAWLAGIILLMADLFLPLPGTVIMSALGYLYGPLYGGIIATLGNILSGLFAFGLCRLLGRRGAEWLLGKKDLEKGEKTFNKNGGWIVAISRWLPIVPEIVACMAGLNQMNFRKFTIALFCGSLPLGFTFAYIGFSGKTDPLLALIISALLPVVLWIMAQNVMRKLLT